MQNVTVKFYKGGAMLEPGKYNCRRCKEYKYCEMHHTVTRSRGGFQLVPLCSECHRWVGEHPKEAAKLGLYVHGYEGDKLKGR